MGISIVVRSRQTAGKDYAGVSAGSPSMLSLVYPVADIIEAKYPQIFEKSYHSVGAGMVYFDDLTPDEFKIVYALTCKQYERFIEDHPTEANRRWSGAKGENWEELMKFMREDDRLK